MTALLSSVNRIPRFLALVCLSGAGILLGGSLSDPSGLLAGSKMGALTGRAEAVIGRPATPMSYAGVARRTTRRAVAVGAAAAAPRVYPYYGGPGCVQAVNAYGQLIYRCP